MEAWEFLSDLTCMEADQARRDRLVADEHAHNLFPYPKITVIRDEANQAALELDSLTPSKRSAAKKEATQRWNEENPNRPLKRSYYNGRAEGEDAPIILDSSDDPQSLLLLLLPERESKAKNYSCTTIFGRTQDKD